MSKNFQADLKVYEFFKSQGMVIVNDSANFTGMNEVLSVSGAGCKAQQKNDLKGQMLMLAPHEGIVPPDVWLACRWKLMNNMKIQSAGKPPTHGWWGKSSVGTADMPL